MYFYIGCERTGETENLPYSHLLCQIGTPSPVGLTGARKGGTTSLVLRCSPS